MSRGEGELLTAPKPRAVSLLSVCLTVKPVGEPDALIGHVRFDERGWETERCRMAQATAPILDSTEPDQPGRSDDVRSSGAHRKWRFGAVRNVFDPTPDIAPCAQSAAHWLIWHKSCWFQTNYLSLAFE